ncbi:hypothetical protein BKA57DRAFT_489768 [Linnemannia elongata]|nr:hypothetical protein BKA57DRAFT_489768 [Linnemannia elongata]
MDLLAPDKGSTVQTVEEVGESLYSTDGDSQVSPCVARQKRREVKEVMVEVLVCMDTRNQDSTLSLVQFTTLGQTLTVLSISRGGYGNINEREGISGLTWSFMQTPLTTYGIQSCYLEVLITAVERRKSQDKDPLLDVKETGQYADAVAIHNNQQLLLAGATLVHYPKLGKRRQDVRASESDERLVD